MLSIQDAWGQEFYANQIEPEDLTTMMVACMANITGARSITEGALVTPSARIANSLMAFYDTVMFMQRDYHTNPENRIVILGARGIPVSCIIKDKDGSIVFDPKADLLASRSVNWYMYRMPTGQAGVYDAQGLIELASCTYLEGVKELRKLGYWKDNSWGYDRDFARGSQIL